MGDIMCLKNVVQRWKDAKLSLSDLEDADKCNVEALQLQIKYLKRQHANDLQHNQALSRSLDTLANENYSLKKAAVC